MDKKVRKSELLRLIIQAVSFAFHNGYIWGWINGKIYKGSGKKICVPGLNCYSCPGAIGSCPIGSLQSVLGSGKYHFSLYVFGAIGAMGMCLGRFICGWLCPFGLVQDLLHKIPFPRKIKNLPGHRYLKYLRYVVLALFVVILPMLVVNEIGNGRPWFCEYICPSGTLFGGYPLIIADKNLRSMAGALFTWKSLVLLAVVILSVISYRPFCKYLCPLGALYGIANPISLLKLEVDKDECVSCKGCQKACGMDIDVYEKPNSPECIRCGKCVAACPKACISYTFSGVKVGREKDH